MVGMASALDSSVGWSEPAGWVHVGRKCPPRRSGVALVVALATDDLDEAWAVAEAVGRGFCVKQWKASA